MGSVTVLVTIHSIPDTLDLELPADVPIRDLLPLVVAVCASRASSGQPGGATQWALGRPGSPPFSADRSLLDYEVMDGAILLLREEAAWGSVSSESLPLLPDESGSHSSEVALGGIGIRWNKQGLLS